MGEGSVPVGEGGSRCPSDVPMLTCRGALV